MPSNEEMHHQNHSQLNNRGSWFFTHIADVVLGRKFGVSEGAKGAETSLQTEVSYLPANFRGLREKLDALTKSAATPAEYVKTATDPTVYFFDKQTGLLRPIGLAEWNVANAAGYRVVEIPEKFLDAALVRPGVGA